MEESERKSKVLDAAAVVVACAAAEAATRPTRSRAGAGNAASWVRPATVVDVWD